MTSGSSYLTCNFNTVRVPSGTTAIILNGSGADNYDISYNTVFGNAVVDNSNGATKRVTGNF